MMIRESCSIVIFGYECSTEALTLLSCILFLKKEIFPRKYVLIRRYLSLIILGQLLT